MFELTGEGLKVVEVAPGVDLERDILDQMEFRPLVPDVVPKMMRPSSAMSPWVSAWARP